MSEVERATQELAILDRLQSVHPFREMLRTLLTTLDELREVAEAARELYERVEMDESVGICLSDRVPSLRLGAALAGLDADTQEPSPGAETPVRRSAASEPGKAT